MMSAESGILSSDIACVRRARFVRMFERDRSLREVARTPKSFLPLPKHSKRRQQTSSR